MAAGSSNSTRQLAFLGLDDDLIAAVLDQSPEGSLGAFASASRRLTRLARTLIPTTLTFKGHESIAVLSSSGGPFSGCTHLIFDCNTAADLNDMSLAVLHASQHYTNLETVWLRCTPSPRDAAAQELLGDGSALVGPLGWLQGLLPLRSLALIVPAIGAHVPAAAARLTQLTALELGASVGSAPVDLAPLAKLPQLQYLWCNNVAVAAAGKEQSCLPSSLQELEVLGREVSPGIWSHLPGCSQLTRLVVQYEGQEQYAASHPSHVVRAAAQACKQLQNMEFGLHERVKRLRFRRQAPGASVEVVPDTHWELPEEAAALTGLMKLATPSACCLRLNTDSSWWLLGRLKKLAEVDVLQVDTLPPSRLRLPWVGMSCKVSQVSVDQIMQLLGTFEQLEECNLTFRVQPQQPQQQQEQQPQQQEGSTPALAEKGPNDQAKGGTVVSEQLKSMAFTYATDASLQQDPELAAQHFAAVAARLPQLEYVSLSWPRQDSPQPALPDLAPLTALTGLTLASCGEPVRLLWRPEHVLHVLKGTESRLLELVLERFELVSPRFALMLSERFTCLQLLELSNCKRLLPQTGPGAGTKDQEEEALQQLQQLLRPGLELVVSPES